MNTEQWKMVYQMMAAANRGHVTKNEAEEILDAFEDCVERYCERALPGFKLGKIGDRLDKEIRDLVRKP